VLAGVYPGFAMVISIKILPPRPGPVLLYLTPKRDTDTAGAFEAPIL